jgi:hypothetical protein
MVVPALMDDEETAADQRARAPSTQAQCDELEWLEAISGRLTPEALAARRARAEWRRGLYQARDPEEG